MLDHLPIFKQIELRTLLAIIRDTAPCEIVILFGSYARGDWVEEKYDDIHYRYQSDFDILVIIENPNEHVQNKIELEIEKKLEQNEALKTPVSVIVHDVAFINRRLKKAQYFFTDIKKEGIVLYDAGRFQLSEARELSVQERYALAKQDFEYWFGTAQEFFDNFYINFEKNRLSTAAFELHQTTERLYSGILLVFTRYKPNSHNLALLRRLCNSVDVRLIAIFPKDTFEHRRLFKLLCKAYVDGRYNPNYAITTDDLVWLSENVRKLKQEGEHICQEKMQCFLDQKK